MCLVFLFVSCVARGAPAAVAAGPPGVDLALVPVLGHVADARRIRRADRRGPGARRRQPTDGA